MLLLPTVTELKRAFASWRADHVPTLAAALAYACTLALAPLLLVVLGVADIFSQSAAVHAELISQINAAVGPQAAALITNALDTGRQSGQGYVAVLAGLAVSLVSSLGALRQLQGAADRIWGTTSKNTSAGRTARRYLALILVLALTCALVVVSTVLSAVLTHRGTFVSDLLAGHIWLARVVQAGGSFALIAGAFSLLFKILPEDHVPWRHVWFSGIFTALLFNVGKSLLAWYLAVGSVGSVYGVAGSFAALMVWIFYAAQIFLYGIELVKARHRSDRLGRARALVPSRT